MPDNLQIDVYADTDASYVYATHMDSKSHSGVIIPIGGRATVQSRSAKQRIVTTSSTEAELELEFVAMNDVNDDGYIYTQIVS